MQTFANIMAIIMTVVTTASIIAMVTPTPQKTDWMKKVIFNHRHVRVKCLESEGQINVMYELFQRGRISEKVFNEFIFYKRAFWICFFLRSLGHVQSFWIDIILLKTRRKSWQSGASLQRYG